jgi:hypothetical protein
MLYCRDTKTTPDYLKKYKVILENVYFYFMLDRICVARYRYFSKMNKNLQFYVFDDRASRNMR